MALSILYIHFIVVHVHEHILCRPVNHEVPYNSELGSDDNPISLKPFRVPLRQRSAQLAEGQPVLHSSPFPSNRRVAAQNEHLMASPALERSGLGRLRLKNMQGNEYSKAAFVKEVFDCAR